MSQNPDPPHGHQRPRPKPGKLPTDPTHIPNGTVHAYNLIYVSDDCVGYSVGDQVNVVVEDPAPSWTPIDLGGSCTDCVGSLAED